MESRTLGTQMLAGDVDESSAWSAMQFPRGGIVLRAQALLRSQTVLVGFSEVSGKQGSWPPTPALWSAENPRKALYIL